MSEPVLVSLHHKTHVAELWHGRTGCAEDFVGSEIPGGYVELLQKLYAMLCEQHLHTMGQPLNLAVSSSVWARAALLAKQGGLPLQFIITPFASLPWKNAALDNIAVSTEQAERYIRNIYREAEYVLHPRTAAAYYALQTHRARLAESTPSLILATQSPIHAEKDILAQLGLDAPLQDVIDRSRKRFQEY